MLTTCSAGRRRLWIVKQRQAERTDRLATIFFLRRSPIRMPARPVTASSTLLLPPRKLRQLLPAHR